jgi:hypothetical protein
MPIEPPNKISQTPVIRREESTAFHQRKKPKQTGKEESTKQEKTGKIDIKV